MKLLRNIVLAFICLLLGVLLAWQFKSISFNKATSNLENKRLEDFKDELLREKHNNEILRERNEKLEEEINQYQAVRGDIDEQTRLLANQLLETKIFAGLVDVKGEGVVITIENNGFAMVEDIDILKVLNELRACDAQAITVNDQRIIAMSEVREAGRYIMINGEQLTTPYTIKAIADPDKVENALQIVGGIVETLELYQLKVNIEKADNIIIPKVDGSMIRTNLLNPVKS